MKNIKICFGFLNLIAVVVLLVTFFKFQPLKAYPGEDVFAVGVSLLIIAMTMVGMLLPWISVQEKWGKISASVLSILFTGGGIMVLQVGYPAMEEAFAVTRSVQTIFVVAIVFTVLCLIRCFFTEERNGQKLWSFVSACCAAFCVMLKCRAADGEYVSLKGFFWLVSVCAVFSCLVGCYCIWSKPKSDDEGSAGGGFASRVTPPKEDICFG